MNAIKSARKLFLLFGFLIASFASTKAQLTLSPTETGNGYSVQEQVSLGLAHTGVTFVYTVTFTLPAGATNVLFDHAISPNVDLVSVSLAPNYSGNVATWAPGGSGIQVTFANPISGTISGSYQVFVRFPYEGACHNTSAFSSVRLIGNTPNVALGTKTIETRSIVDKTWHLQKASVNTTYVGGASCDYITTSTVVKYEIRISRAQNVVFGSTALDFVSLIDNLALGGTASNFQNLNNMAGASISASGVVTPPTMPFIMDPTQIYRFRFDVTYPPGNFPPGTCVSNSATLTAVADCNTTRTYSDTADVRRVDSLPPGGQLNKFVTTTGALPGCTGVYTIRVRNTGGSTMTYSLVDNFPPCLLNVQLVSSPSGSTVSGTAPNFVMSANNLAPGQTHNYTFSFTIGTGCTSPIINVVTATTPPTLGSAQANIALLPPGAKPCIVKQVCAPTIVNVGDTIRFRLRIQNIGGTPITGANITDQLDLGNLQYLPGNDLHYFAPNTYTYPNCAPVVNSGNQWGNFNSTYNPGTGMITWNIPDIPVECGTITNPVCGGAGHLPAYYIEFLARVRDTAGIGNARNFATIKGGNINNADTSRAWAPYIIAGLINYGVTKTVSTDNVNFAANQNAPAGSTVYYKLNVNNLGVPISNAVLVDLLPRDNGGTDNFILANAVRSNPGAFNIRYSGFNSSTHTNSGQFSSTASGITTTPELGFTVNTNPAAWSPSYIPGAANIKTNLNQIIGSSPLNYVFNAQVDPAATVNTVSCNTFAMRGRAKYMTNYVANYVPLTPIESARACVTATQASDPCCKPKDFHIPKEVCLGTATMFCVVDDCKEGEIEYFWDFGDGTPEVSGTCVSHAYAQPGSYTITVRWKTECGEDKKEFKVEVKECPCEIKVGFEVRRDDLTIVADGSVTTSTQPIALYVWDFGDGTYGTGQVATHTYAAYGNYSVTLTVYSMNSKGEICECKDRCKTEINVDKGKKEFRCNPELFEKRMMPMQVLSTKNPISINASPNPFSDRVAVSFTVEKSIKADNQHFVLEFVNPNGAVLQTRKLNTLKGQVVFETGSYSSGIYFIFLKGADGKIQNTKVIKLK